MKFEGKFQPPSIGAVHMPIPISGQGSCALDDAGLTVEGHASSTGRAALLAVGGGLTAAAAAYGVKIMLFPNMSASTVGTVFAVGLISGAMAPAGAKSGKTVRYSFPWSSIKKVALNPQKPGEVIVTIKKHKPKGTLHFVPADPDAFAAHVANGAEIPIS